ncbi:MAG TPA: immunoglobulin-like domain-containing protein, partial [Candidatus Paceibacterota bacterium]|nr:immunoglobulin-like domain-containing protein [Candidatus Paceibacterota bacterium]
MKKISYASTVPVGFIISIAFISIFIGNLFSGHGIFSVKTAEADTPTPVNITGAVRIGDTALSGNPGYAGAAVQLISNADGSLQTQTTSAGDGTFTVSVSPVSDYKVCFTVPTGYGLLSGGTNCQDITLPVADTQVADFTISKLPVITVTPAMVFVDQHSTYTDSGVTALKDTTDVTSLIAATGTVNTSVPAVYTINYSLTDTVTGYVATASRSVTVVSVAGGGGGGSGSDNSLLNATSIYGYVRTGDTVDINNPAIAGVMIELRDTSNGNAVVATTSSYIGGFSFLIIPGNYQACVVPAVEYGSIPASPACQTVVYPDPTDDVTLSDFTISDRPVIQLNGDATVSVVKDTVYEDDGATASRGRDDLTALIVASSTVDMTTVGTYAVTYNVIDPKNGLSAISVVRTVNVTPVVPPPPVTYIDMSGMVRSGTVASTSNAGVSGVVVTLTNTVTHVATTTTTDATGAFLVNTPTADYSVCITAPLGFSALSSNCYTAASSSANIIVPDFTVAMTPVITLNGSSTVNILQNSTYVDLGATAVQGVNDISSSIVAAGNIVTTVPGTYTVTYDVVDPVTQLAAVSVVRTVIVNALPTEFTATGTLREGTAASALNPVYALGAAVELKDMTSEVLATTTTDASGAFSFTISTTGNHSVCLVAPSGYGVIGLSCIDIAQGNTNVTLDDFTIALRPIITLNGSSTIDILVGGSYDELGGIATAGSRTLAATVTPSGVVNTNLAGQYIITYNVVDELTGFTASAQRIVNVNTPPHVNVAPVITILGLNPVDLVLGASYVDAGATSTDAEDGDLTSRIIVDDQVNAGVLGTYTVTYSVTDNNGATTTVTRIVNVVAAPTEYTASGTVRVGTAASSSNPVYALGATIELQDGMGNVLEATTTDANGSFSFVIPLLGDHNVCLVTPDTFGVINSGCVLLTQGTSDITLSDFTITELPVITPNGGSAITIVEGDLYIEYGATALAGSRVINAVIDITGNITPDVPSTPGTYTVTYSVTDEITGFVTSATRTVIVTPLNSGNTSYSISGSVRIGVVASSTNPGYVLGVSVDLQDAGGTVIASTTTDANGAYSFAITAAGDYNICFAAPLGFGIIDSSCISVPQSASDVANNDFTISELPVITLNGSSTISIVQGSSYVDAGALAMAGTRALAATVLPTGIVDTAVPGTYIITYNVVDEMTGFTADPVTRTITVTAKAEFTAGGTVRIGTSADVNNPGYVLGANVELRDATDVVIATTTADVSGAFSFLVPATGAHTVCLVAPADFGIVAPGCIGVPEGYVDLSLLDFTVYQLPVVTLNGSSTISIEQGTAYDELGATAVAGAHTVTTPIVVSGTVDINTPATYILTYTATDQITGFVGTTTRTVVVTPHINVAPVITVIGSNPVNVIQGTTYVDEGATALDAEDGALTVTI